MSWNAGQMQRIPYRKSRASVAIRRTSVAGPAAQPLPRRQSKLVASSATTTRFARVQPRKELHACQRRRSHALSNLTSHGNQVSPLEARQ
jgi:hypothetical protein